jgi:hypothetical protein
MKEGSLFCFVVMKSTKPRCFRSCSWCFWGSFQQGGVHGLGSTTFGLVVQKFLNIEQFLHWKINKIIAENFRRIGMCLCCWKDLDEQEIMEFI